MLQEIRSALRSWMKTQAAPPIEIPDSEDSDDAHIAGSAQPSMVDQDLESSHIPEDGPAQAVASPRGMSEEEDVPLLDMRKRKRS